jgi:hypothetical protein
MRQGIHLGAASARPKHPVTALVASALVGALALGILCQRERGKIEAFENEIARLEEAFRGSPSRTAIEQARFAAARLSFALDSGAPESVPPTALLHLAEKALPQGIVLERLSFDGSGERSLTIEASALGDDRVTELQRRLLASAFVAATRVLEERRLPDGGLTVRVQVDLREP